MNKSMQIGLYLILSVSFIAPSAFAEQYSAAITSDKGGPVLAACRQQLAPAVIGAGFSVLGPKADPVTADVVFSVELKIQKRGDRRSAACSVNAFEAATAAQVARAAELGSPHANSKLAAESVCKLVSEQLSRPLKKWQDLVAKRGMGHTITLRWTGELKPNPKSKILEYLKSTPHVSHQRRSGDGQVQYLVYAKTPTAQLGSKIRGFLEKYYQLHTEPPVNLPSNKRSFMYLLRKK